MTKGELVELLAEYPDDTPIFDARGYDLHQHHVRTMNYDNWNEKNIDAEGWEIPGVGIGVAIGRR